MIDKQKEEWGHVLQVLETDKVNEQIGGYLVKDGLLYRNIQLPDGFKLRLCIPKQLKLDVLRACHDDITAGHLGENKTLDKIQSRFFWPGQKKGCSGLRQTIPLLPDTEGGNAETTRVAGGVLR